MIALLIALAQTPTTANVPTTGVALDLLRPKFDGGGTTLLSGAAFVSGRTHIGKMRLSFELPFAHVENSFIPSNTSIGNPYIGFEFGGATGLSGSAGTRLPLASETDAAPSLGLYADVSRIEAFRVKTFTVQGTVRYRVRNANGMTFDASAGPAVWLPTNGDDEAEVVVHHQFSGGYRGSLVWLAAGFSGWTWLTKEQGGAGPGTSYEFNASVGGARGRIRPALHLILPIDYLYKLNVDYVIGFGIAFGG